MIGSGFPIKGHDTKAFCLSSTMVFAKSIFNWLFDGNLNRTQSDSVKLSMSSTLWKKVIIFFPNSQINTVLDEQLQIVTFKVKTNTFCCRVQTEGRSRHLRPSVWSYFRRRFQVWMCGGQLMIATCSHVGHVFRKSTPYTFPGGTSKIVNHNNARLAEVWLDDWKEFYFSINPGENNAGDLKMIA